MAILLLVVLVGMLLSAMIVPVIITQDRTTKFDTTRVQALDAAQSGIDVVQGLIRASTTTTAGANPITTGNVTTLPCGPVSGRVNTPATSAPANSVGIAEYSVLIEYFAQDPVTYPSASKMNCAQGYGTFGTPSFARLTSTGTVGAALNGSTGGRTLTSTYGLKTSNVNLAGGVIKLKLAANAVCMDVGSAAAAGSIVVLQTCSTSKPPAAQQVFAYRTDLSLELVSSAPVNTAGFDDATGCAPSSSANCGLCLDAATTPAVSGNTIQLDSCGPIGSPATQGSSRYTQQWSFNDNGAYEAAKATSASDGGLAGLCMNVPAETLGQQVTLLACNNDKDLLPQSWAPDALVGPGGATLAARNQWINYSEFGRCIDVKGLNIDTPQLQDYPCKQNPSATAVTWNQRFQSTAPTAGQLTVTSEIFTRKVSGGQKYCLTSPGTSGYPTMKTCDGSSAQQWIIYSGDRSLPYALKYQVISGSLCLGLADPTTLTSPWSAIDVEACTGTTEQKWNASANVLTSSQKDTREK